MNISIKELDENTITQKHINGVTIEQLSKEYGCSVSPIRKILLKNIGKIINHKLVYLNDNDIKLIITLYNNGLTTNEISKKYKVSPKRISNILRENNISLRVIRENYSNNRKIIDKNWLYNQHIIQKKSLHKIKKEYNIERSILRKALNDYNIPHINYHHINIPKELLDKNWLYDQHIIQKKSVTQISKDINCKNFIIKKQLKLYNIPHINYNFSQSEKYNYYKNDYNFFKDIYSNTNKTIKELSNDLDIGHTQLSREMQKIGIVTYNKNGLNRISLSEISIQNFLIENNIDFISQYKLDNRKSIDIFLPNYNIGIEILGEYWHSYNPLSKIQTSDSSLHFYNKSILANNIRLYYFYNTEYNNKKDLILSIILNSIGLSKKIFARKCIIQEVSNIDKNEFFEKNHLQGTAKSSINYGLYYDNKLYSIMSFSKTRFHKKYEYELIRYATEKNIRIIGGASKLFSNFIKNYNPKSIISYADLRYSLGDVYYKLGFKLTHKTLPGYYWFKSNKIYNRQSFQKKNLINFPNYDENKTEKEIMFENGYRILKNCGNLVFVWKK